MISAEFFKKSEQLFFLDWLGKVIIHAGIETDVAVSVHGMCGERDDGYP